MAYFERVGATSFRATEHVGGAWNTSEQHIAPALGLLVHAVELDRDARRDDGLIVARLSFDILGTVPVDVVDIAVTVVRTGRTIELVEATLSHGGRVAVVLRAWLLQQRDTTGWQGRGLAAIPPPDAMPAWDGTTVWAGGFIASVEVRRTPAGPGRAAFWVRTPLALVRGEAVSPLARAAGLFDIANGLAVRAAPHEVAFPNLDLSAHLFATPRGEWVGFDTAVSFGAAGVGLTSSVVHDAGGPVGTAAQVLTLRPR
jgi:hypothetical protein